MLFLDDPSLPGNGGISGVFWDPGRRILAVASTFKLLTEPRARAAYGGHKLRHRLALYRPPQTRPFAVFDRAAFSINDVAFHPSRPVLVIGAGRYDGGYMFEGQIVLWDWDSGRSTTHAPQIPEVVRVRFADDGSAVEAIVRPWHEGAVEGRGDPFDLFFEVTLACDGVDFIPGRADAEIGSQIDKQVPRSASEVAADPDHRSAPEEREREIARAMNLERRHRRSPIWDVALLDADTIGLVHDECLLEIHGRAGGRRHALRGKGYGVQILRARNPLVHVSHFDRAASNWSAAYQSALMTYDDGRLTNRASLDGSYVFSVSADGSILGRANRSHGERGRSKDVIMSSAARGPTRLDLGHYDVFNHYLRIDGAPFLFFVQGTPPSSHKLKHLCIVDAGGGVRRLWPLLEDAGDHASHAMECSFAYVHDRRGQGIVVAGRHYCPSPREPYSGFIYRKNLEDGRELWRHPTTASATCIKSMRDAGLVLVAFLDGGFAMLQSDTGEIRRWESFEPDGYPGVIFALDVDASHLLIGTIDGRCGLLPVSELMSGGIN